MAEPKEKTVEAIRLSLALDCVPLPAQTKNRPLQMNNCSWRLAMKTETGCESKTYRPFHVGNNEGTWN